MKVKAVLGVITIVLVGALGIWIGPFVPFLKQWPLYEALRTTGSIIFTVMGIWIAVICPRALTKMFDRRTPSDDPDVQSANQLMPPLRWSTAILVAVSGLGIAAETLRQIPQAHSHVGLLRGIAFGTLVLLTILQVWSLLRSLYPAEQLRRRINAFTERAKRVESFKSDVRPRQAGKESEGRLTESALK